MNLQIWEYPGLLRLLQQLVTEAILAHIMEREIPRLLWAVEFPDLAEAVLDAMLLVPAVEGILCHFKLRAVG